jgi:hypothetical protein
MTILISSWSPRAVRTCETRDSRRRSRAQRSPALRYRGSLHLHGMRQARRGREAGLQLDMVEGPTLRPRSVAHALFSLRVALRSITRRVLGRLFDGPWSRCSTPKDNPDANQHHASADQDYAEKRKLEARRAMKLCAALDTSSSRTAICVVNSRDGSIVYEASVATDPAIIFGALAPFLPRLESVGHEAGVCRLGCIVS